MSASEPQDPKTLGEKLSRRGPTTPRTSPRLARAPLAYTLLNIGLLTALTTLPMWWILMRPDIGIAASKVMFALLAGSAFISHQIHRTQRRTTPVQLKTHPLLANDRQGFMADLRLDAKTAVIDGSNIYHFGHSNKLDAHPLGAVADQLRREGYRIVCFFDANIFYTLIEHGAIRADQPHSRALLENVFGLRHTEIYVVPSGVQADKYVLDSLLHLPISVAVTNDQFRDYARLYPTVMKGNQWRKGMVISKNEIKLINHRFKSPVYLA